MTEAPAAIDVELVRGAMLEELGRHPDALAHDAMASAPLELRASNAWESSGGRVQAFRLFVGLDVPTLHALERAPSIKNALEAAAARAVTRYERVSIGELVPWWAFASSAPAAHYRDVGSTQHESDRDDPAQVGDALAQWCALAAEPGALELLGRATLSITARRGGRVLVIASRRRERPTGFDEAHALRVLRDAATVLLRGPDDASVEVKLARR